MEEVYTITDWRAFRGNIYTGTDYVLYGIVCSSKTRKDAVDYIRNTIGAKFEKGYYFKGEHMYKIQKTKVIG